MLEIRKFEGIDPDDRQTVEAAFAQIEPQAVACCNWPEAFPYAPQVEFRMFHTGEWLLLRFDVAEQYTMARVTQDNGRSWTDSCVEFFISPDGKEYYNFETTCAGRLLLAWHRSRHEAEQAPQEVLQAVKRFTSLPFGQTFEERVGDNHWSLTLAIPPRALFRHALNDWSGLQASANLYKCGDELSQPHFLSWSPIRTEKPDFHRPEFFAPIRFVR